MWKRGCFVILLAVAVYWAQLTPTLPLAQLRTNAEKRFNRTGLSPLSGKTAVVTGASGGLGFQTALQLYSLGCNVILAVRSLAKCETIKASRFPPSPATCECALIDTADLDSVSAFAKVLTGRPIDLLINNAGISYHSFFDPSVNPLKNLSLPTASPQNVDLLFATNYLGHWLLTELLLPSLTPDARIINVASTYHWQVDGSGLLPVPSSSPSSPPSAPWAAQALAGDARQRKLAYANSKLAQVLHARELDKRLRQAGKKVRALSVCPGWVATDILPKGPIGKGIHALSYTETAGTLAILHAVTTPELESDYFCNGFVFELPESLSKPLFSALGSFGLRDAFGDMLVLGNLWVQRVVYGRQLNCNTSPEAFNQTITKGLFDWSASFVHKYLPSA